MNPRIYIYKITFEEIPDWYWGVHKETVFGELYLGSPITHKWKWEFYTPKIQILQFFPNTKEGWKDAQLIEKRLIRPDLRKTLCLNQNCGGVINNKGRVHTEKSKQNFRAAHSTPKAKQKRSEITKEVFSRPEVIESVSQKALDRWATRKEELSASMRGVKIGYHWWVNQEGETRSCPDSPGNDWQPGRVWKTPQ
jgi:hypothetical protein